VRRDGDRAAARYADFMTHARGLLGLVLSGAVACGTTPSPFSTADGGAPAGDAGNPTPTGGPTFAADSGVTVPVGAACSEAAKLVYTVTRENVLYSFAPSTATFTRVGALGCDARGATPFAMAVDRSAKAWVLYNDGHLFTVSTEDARCEATAFVPNQRGFLKFGMGFSADAPGASSETLFVDDVGGGQGFGRIDLATMLLTPLGDHTDGLSSYGADVTGTGDGRVFGFFTSTPATVGEFVKATGATPAASQHRLAGVDTGTDWAFAFWGGDFWLFTAARGATSNVTQFRPSDGTTRVVARDVGFHVNGAGVSTCAPTAPPPR